MRPRSRTAAGPLRVAILQGNDKNRDLTAAEKDARYLPSSHFELAAGSRDPVDLIVFPESSMDDDPRDDRVPAAAARRSVAPSTHAWVLANAVADAPDGPRAVNLTCSTDPTATLAGHVREAPPRAVRRVRPVPQLPRGSISALDQVPRDFEPGDEPGLFDVAGHRIATVICFESAFGYQVRPLVRDGAEVIVVSTNNRSYGGRRTRPSTSRSDRCAPPRPGGRSCRPRSRASRRSSTPTARCTTETELFERTVLEATVTATRGETPYVRFGEWVVWTALIAVVSRCSSSASSGAAAAP